MRIAVSIDKDMRGITYAYPIELAESFEKVFARDRIAEIDVNEDDIVYVVMSSDNIKSENGVIANIPDFLYEMNPVNTSTNWDVIKECIEDERSRKNVSLTAFVNVGNKYVRGCNLMIAKCGESCIDFRTSLESFKNIVNYYEKVVKEG